jgi:two-component system chemotaxis sensor kinase CheA
VIVFTEGGRAMGLLVDEILDIREERLAIERRSRQPGVIGTAIINGRATEVLDTQHYVTRAVPKWYEESLSLSQPRVLVVDDSLFFRQLVTTTLETEGYRVVGVENATEALGRLEHGNRFDAVIVDVNMPLSDGLAFAGTLRARPQTQQAILIALSGIEPGRIERAVREAGYDESLTKFDAEELLRCLRQLSEPTVERVPA